MYPELREAAELTAAIDNNLREQPTMDIHSFVRRIRRALRINTTHVWRRDSRGVVSCVEMQEMSPVERSTSFRGPPEHIWTYLVNVEDYDFQPPTLVMVVNLLRGMCYPDQDKSMAVLSEMVQTRLYTQELLRVVYKHMVSMAQTLRDQLIAVDDDRLSKAHNEVEVLQKEKNKTERDLYKMQEGKE